MAVSSYLESIEPPLKELDTTSFFDLQAQQIADLRPILFTRIVHHSTDRQHREAIAYAKDTSHLSADFIDYLKSERWLGEYPAAFTVSSIELENPKYFGYLCPWGYRNSQPEYIQVIADRPLPPGIQVYLQRAAMSIDYL